MWKFALISVLFSAGLFLLDLYVYRNWRRFARYRKWSLGWTLKVYRVLLPVMPAALPLYFLFSRWWEVEPKLFRALFIGAWAVYYLPKVPILLVLGLRDLAKGVTWLFGWFQERLLTPASAPQAEASEEASETPAEPVESDALDLSDMNRMTRGEFLQKMGWSAAAIPFVVVGYGVFRTLYDFEVHRVDVPIRGLPRAFDGLRIGQFSDLHAGSFFSARPMHEAVALLNEAAPDLVTITGDYVNHDAGEAALILPALREVKAEFGVFGCLGNHDHYAQADQVAARVRTTPVDLLVNEHRTLQIDGARLHVIGTDNTGFNQYHADLPRALSGLEAHPAGEEVRLLLAHDPSFWDGHVRPDHPEIDLMLCGHTHGGQIGFEVGPLRWSLARVVYPRWAGLYREARPDTGAPQYLYVNRGLGTVGPPLRLGMRPEVTLLTLRRA